MCNLMLLIGFGGSIGGFWCDLGFCVCVGNRKKRRRSSGLVSSKKKRRLLPFNPSEDDERRLEQMRSLATALVATGAEFRNELTYMPGMAPRSANCPDYERDGMQVNYC